MAIQVNGTQVIGNSRELTNIASVDATTAASITAAGVGGGGQAPFAWYEGGYIGLNSGNGIDIAFGSGSNILIVDAFGEAKASTDGGVSWGAQMYGPGGANSFRGVVGDPTATSTFLEVYSSGTSGIYRTTNNGTNWTSVYTGITPSSLAVSPDGSKFVAGSFAPGSYINVAYSSNGTSWSKSSNINNSGYFARGIAIADNGTSCMVTGQASVWRSTNSGASYTVITTNLTGELEGIATDNNGTWVAVGNQGRVFRSTNDGVTWSRATFLSGADLKEVNYGGGAFVLTSSTRAPMYSTDGGENWITTIPTVIGLEWMTSPRWQPSTGQWWGFKETSGTKVYLGGITNE